MQAIKALKLQAYSQPFHGDLNLEGIIHEWYCCVIHIPREENVASKNIVLLNMLASIMIPLGFERFCQWPFKKVVLGVAFHFSSLCKIPHSLFSHPVSAETVDSETTIIYLYVKSEFSTSHVQD